jgi:FixJ family two-component response regulator
MGKGAIEYVDMPAATSLFALSFRQSAEIAQIAASAGWQADVLAQADDVAAAYLASGAAVAVVDARGALDQGLAATQALGGLIAANGDALVVLVSRGDIGAIGEFFELGATQFLASPMSEGELVQALRFAGRHAARAAGVPIERRVVPGGCSRR